MIRHIVLVVVLVLLPGIVTAKSFPVLWNEAMEEEMAQAHSDAYALSNELSRLQKELNTKLEEVKKSGKCKKLDCKELQQIFIQFDKVDNTALASIALFRLALEQREEVADNQHATVNAIQRGTKDIQHNLWLQELTLAASDLTLNILTGLATGQPQNITSGLANVGATIGNYLSNKALNAAIGHQSLATDITAGITRDMGVDLRGQAAVAEITGKLTRLGVVKAEAGKIVFQDPVKPMALNMKSLDVANIVVQSIIRAATASAVDQNRKDLQKALLELKKALQFRMEMIATIAVHKMLKSKASELQGVISQLRDEMFKLKSACEYSVRKTQCGIKLEQALQQAKAQRDTVKKNAKQARDKAKLALDEKRKAWRSKLTLVQDTHQALRVARDDLARAEGLARDRETIENLARNARDAAVREKYQAQLAEANRLGKPADLRVRVNELVRKRQSLWDEIEKNQKDIAGLSDNMLAVYRQTDQAINAAESQYTDVVHRARDVFLNCTGLQASFASVNRSPSLEQVRKQHPGQIFPYDMFKALHQEMDTLLKGIRRVHVRVSATQAAGCDKAVTTRPAEKTTPPLTGETWIDLALANGVRKRVVFLQNGSKLKAEIPMNSGVLRCTGTSKPLDIQASGIQVDNRLAEFPQEQVVLSCKTRDQGIIEDWYKENALPYRYADFRKRVLKEYAATQIDVELVVNYMLASCSWNAAQSKSKMHGVMNANISASINGGEALEQLRAHGAKGAVLMAHVPVYRDLDVYFSQNPSALLNYDQGTIMKFYSDYNQKVIDYNNSGNKPFSSCYDDIGSAPNWQNIVFESWKVWLKQ